MSQILSQSEVDALLAAVSEGEIGQGGEGGAAAGGANGGTPATSASSSFMISHRKTGSSAAGYRSSTLSTKNSCALSGCRFPARSGKLQR